jgi:hypothetical protein
MNSMQWSVAILGALVVVGVLVYNAWAMRRAQPRQAVPKAKSKSAPQAQVEPLLDDLAPAGSADEPGSEGLTSVAPGDDLSGLSARSPATEAVLDALIDSVVPVALASPVSGDAVLAAMPATRRVGSKTLVVECQGDDGEWERPQTERRYQAMQVGLQLANRSGAINNIEFSEFVAKVQHLADALGGAPDFPDMLAEVARAKELDQFASAHDAQLGLVLRAKGAAWSVGFVHHHAAAAGLIAGAVPGRMVLPAAQPDHPPLLNLRFDTQAALDDDHDAALRELRLVLDVAQVSRDEQPFEHMCELARRLAEVLDAEVVDDGGSPLPEPTLVQIGQELQQLYDALDQRELSAGSVLARRLFS